MSGVLQSPQTRLLLLKNRKRAVESGMHLDNEVLASHDQLVVDVAEDCAKTVRGCEIPLTCNMSLAFDYYNHQLGSRNRTIYLYNARASFISSSAMRELSLARDLAHVPTVLWRIRTEEKKTRCLYVTHTSIDFLAFVVPSLTCSSRSEDIRRFESQ